MPATSPISTTSNSNYSKRPHRKVKKVPAHVQGDSDDKENVMMQGQSLKLRISPEDSIKAALETSMMAATQVQSPTTMHALAPGTVYTGTQKSKNQVYKVSIAIQSQSASRVSGYLTIDSLSEVYPQLTTCFEGQIIDGEKYTFFTEIEDSSFEMDELHWNKFESFKKLGCSLKDQPADIPERIAENGHVYMRWKEQFLVPDHSVTNIDGVSFAGFYYIDLDIARQTVEGYYYHKNSELFQHLQLTLQTQKQSDSYGFR